MEATQKAYRGSFSFFWKHLNGDYSLGRSYWVNTLLLQFFLSRIGLLLTPWLEINLPASYGALCILLLSYLAIFVWVWAISGTWASANKHVLRGGKKGWAIAAKFVIVFGVLRAILASHDMTDILFGHRKATTRWQLGPNITLQVRADGKSILLKGGINEGAAESLSKALDLAPSVKTVVLQSTGGWVRQGDMIAKVISEHGLNTYVEQECSSACTIAFLAGRERAGEPTARIGFHSFRSIGVYGTVVDPVNSSITRSTYKKAGLSSTFIAKVIATPPNKMWYPSQDELLAEGVFTRLTPGE